MSTVTAQLRSGTRATLSTRHFSWLADEPTALGGTDEGPNPYEILLGALAACTAITLRLYADHKGIQLDGVDVSLEFDRVHAEDCLECEGEGVGLIERVQSHVTMHGSFSAAQRQRLEQVAQRCPVHRTLARGVQIFGAVSLEEGG